jgi:prepilin-type processing-associated H-X9-DG protein
MHELQYAWMLYVIDNDDYVPLNQTAPAPNYRRVFSRNSSTNSWVAGNPTVDLTDANIRRGSLFPHVRSTQVYRCPMDDSTVVNHPEIRRTRSYSMNALLGGDNPDENPRVKMRFADWVSPGKESTFVFIEEHKDSIWTPGFVVLPRENPLSISSFNLNWVSTPSDRHNQGCNLSFADGHVEYWRWYSPKDRASTTKMASSSREMSDIRRLQNAVPQDK